MRSSSISWDESARRVEADPAATVAFSRAQWAQRGARFHETDDGQGEHPGLAVGSLATAQGTIDIGVLDYGEPVTYLLVSRASADRRNTVVAALAALSDDGVLDLEADVVDTAGAAAGRKTSRAHRARRATRSSSTSRATAESRSSR